MQTLTGKPDTLQHPKITLLPVSSPDVVRFSGRKTPEPRFIAPMVVENVPEFDPQNPEAMAFYHDLWLKAQSFSQANVSKYRVGTILIGESGRAYLGTNIEVKGNTPADTIHGEAFAVVQARRYKETGFRHLIVGGPVCGHCRQMLLEAGNPDLNMHTLDGKSGRVTESRLHRELLPSAFDSTGVGPSRNLLLPTPSPVNASLKVRHPLVKQAIQGAVSSYLPKAGRKGWAGIAFLMKDGQIHNGGTITVSGANPTITPVQEALVKVISDGQQFADIERVVLAEPEAPDYSYYQQTRAVLKQLAPQASVTRYVIPAKALSGS